MKISLKKTTLNTVLAGMAAAPFAQALPPMMDENPMARAGAATSAGVLASAATSSAAAPAPARAKRPWGTIGKAPWIATMDRIKGTDPTVVHLIGEFGNDPSLLAVRFDGKDVPFKMVNSSLLAARPANIAADALVEVQLGDQVSERGWHRGTFSPSTVASQFLTPSGGSMGHLIAYSEERDLRPDGKGGLACWGSRAECYRVVDYNWMVVKAFGEQGPDPYAMTAGPYAGKAELPEAGSSTAAK